MKTTLKILAIDDLPDNLTTLKAVVADALPGVTVLTALSGPQGIELARTEDPDVILLDIIMPGMDGFTVCRKLKADARLRTIPVIFLTALKTGRESRVQAVEAGAEAFLAKPIDEVELTAQIRAMSKIKAANRMQQREYDELAALVADRTRALEQELATRRQTEATLQQLNQQLEKGQRTMLNLLEDQHEAAAALRESHAINESLLQTIPFPMDIVDEHGRLLFVSARMEQVLGRRPVGERCWDVYREDQTQCVACPLRLPIAVGETKTMESSGAVGGKTMQIHHTGMMFQGQKALMEIFIDITERQRTEAALREEQMLFQSMASTIPDYIYFKDRSSRFIRVNLATAKIFGLNDPAEAVGKTDADFFTAAHAQQAFADEQRIMTTGEPLIGSEEKETWPDGHVTWVSTTKVPLRAADGTVTGLVGVSRDITRHKETEATLADQLEELRRWHKAMLGRESRMVELKGEINRLLVAAGQPPRFHGLEQENEAATEPAAVNSPTATPPPPHGS